VGVMESRGAGDGRYRTLLEVSSAIASQPNLKAVLQSLRRLLSSVVAFDSVSLSLHLTEARKPIKSKLALRFNISGPLSEEQSTNKYRYTFLTCRPSFQEFPNWHRKRNFRFRTAYTYFPSRYPGRNSGR
jgi:hypothetical protein